MEDLGLVEEVVLVADPLAEGGSVVPRISRDDPVDKGAVDAAGGLEPLGETFTELPEVDILTDALLEMFAVFKNQFAGEEDETLGLVPLEELVPVVEELGQLSGIREGRLVRKLAVKSLKLQTDNGSPARA